MVKRKSTNKGNNKITEQSYKGKVKTHNYINRQNQSTTGKGQKDKQRSCVVYIHVFIVSTLTNANHRPIQI